MSLTGVVIEVNASSAIDKAVSDFTHSIVLFAPNLFLHTSG